MTCEDFMDSLKRKHSSETQQDFNWWTVLDAIVFIDCTWQQSYQMLQVRMYHCVCVYALKQHLAAQFRYNF